MKEHDRNTSAKKRSLHKKFVFPMVITVFVSLCLLVLSPGDRDSRNHDENSGSQITQDTNQRSDHPDPESNPNNTTPKDITEEPSSSSQNPNVPADLNDIAAPNKPQAEASSPPPSLPPSPSTVLPINVSSTTILSGQLTSIELPELIANQTYEINLSGYDFSNLALIWPSGDLHYNLTHSSDTPELSPIPLPDDIQQFEDNLVSELLYPSPSDNDYLYISSDEDLDYLKIDLINPEPSSLSLSVATLSSTGIYNKDAGAKYTTLNIISRDEWGANPSSWDPYDHSNIDDPNRLIWIPTYHPVYRITVHHTAGTNNPPDPAATVRSIYIYHTYTRGWGDIGYNYLIDHRGNIYEGKLGGEEVYGYHAYTEANAMSVGISLLGNFMYTYPTSAAQNSLIKLMAEKAALLDFDLKYSNGTLSKWRDTSYTVFGHRDAWLWCYNGHPLDHLCPSYDKWIINQTACPGDKLRSLLSSTITANAQTYKNSHFSGIHNIVDQVNYAIAAPHQDDTLLVLFNRPETVSEAEILSLIPEFSGITNVDVNENFATITIKDWNNGGDSVPPDGWDGYSHPGTFFPEANGSEDRLKTLLKILRMDPDVKAADLCHTRELF